MLNTSRSHFAQRFIEGGGSTEQLTEKTNRPRHIPTIYDASDWRADSLTNKGWPVKNILNTLRLNAKHLLLVLHPLHSIMESTLKFECDSTEWFDLNSTNMEDGKVFVLSEILIEFKA